MELGYPVIGRVSGGRGKEYWVSCDGPCRLCSWRTGVRLVPRWKEIKRSRFPGISQQEIYRHALLSSSHLTNFWQETKSLSKASIIKGWHAYASALWRSSDCTHAHNHVTKAVAAMDTCFDLVRAHHHGIVMCGWHGFVHVRGVGHDGACARENPSRPKHFRSWKDLFCAFGIGWKFDGPSGSPLQSEVTFVLSVDKTGFQVKTWLVRTDGILLAAGQTSRDVIDCEESEQCLMCLTMTLFQETILRFW